MGRPEDIFNKIKQLGEMAIDEFILTRQAEELFLDFKRSANDGKGPKVLHSTDLNNLARAISGFGNSEGGVVVWGVDASLDVDYADVAKAKRPIKNVARFVSWLQGAVSGRTIPAHTGVEHWSVDTDSGSGFVATYIPKSELAPHQSIGDSRYYMRAGSSFLPVPHAVLAGMFGRRPQPTIYQTYVSAPATIRPLTEGGDAIDVNLGFQIYNKGPVIVRDLYSNLMLLLPKENCGGQFEPNSTNWDSQLNFGVWLSQVSKEGFKVGPESFASPFSLKISFAPPFTEGKLWLRWIFGCENSPMHVVEIEQSYTEVESLYRALLAGPKTHDERQKFVNDLFKLSQQQEQFKDSK